MKDLLEKLKKLSLPSWLKCPRSVWAVAIAVAFILGYLMGMYVEPNDPSEDADVREDPLRYHSMQDEEYGFHKRVARV